MQKLKCDPETEIVGMAMIAIIQNLVQDEIQPLLDKHDLKDIKPETWYPAQRWLDVMNDLLENPNAATNLVAVGMSIASRIQFPPGVGELPFGDFLARMDNIYHFQHRGGEPGHILAEKVSDTHYKMLNSSIYPDDLDYGVFYGFARRFLPSDIVFSVKYDEGVKRRDVGGEMTVYHIQWEAAK